MGSWFPDQGSNLHSMHWEVKSYPLDHQGSPKYVLFWKRKCIFNETQKQTLIIKVIGGFPSGSVVKNPLAIERRHRRCRLRSLSQKMPWKRKWQPTPEFLPGESQGHRSLEGCSPQGHKEWDAAEQKVMEAHYEQMGIWEKNRNIESKEKTPQKSPRLTSVTQSLVYFFDLSLIRNRRK